MRWKAVPVLVLVAACAPGAASSTTGTTPTTLTTTTVSPTPTTAPVTVTTLPVTSGCPGDGEFADRGQVGRIDQPTTDTNILGHISWSMEEGCERFRFDFETTEGAPATTPPSVRAEFLDTGQVLRISLDLGTTVISDQLVETPLVDRLYVVRALDGGMFVDLHLSTPTLARIDVDNSPAALTLELETGIEPFTGLATISDRTVVTEPLDATETTQMFEVTGYARTFEANVLVIATIGTESIQQSTQAADWSETWGEFSATLDLPPGPASVFVGEESPADGSLDGVMIDVMVR